MSERKNLVLLPGLLCTRALWAPQIDAFSGSHEVLVPDLGQQDSISAMATHVLETAPERFSLAGLSMGGYVAFEVFRQAPDRVERIAFLDTSARPDTEEKRVQRNDLINLAKRGNFKGVSPQLMPLFIHPDRADDTVLTGVITAMAKDIGAESFVNQQHAISGRADSRPTLAQINCPALVVVGEFDILTPPWLSDEIAEGIGRATLSVIPDAAHLPTLEEPDATNDVMKDWLRRDI
jgi:pimeloyl-ACP methyl ester carboxylesterase